MPQLILPGNPLAIGIETAALGYLFGLPADKAIMMGGVYFFYNLFIQKSAFKKLTPTGTLGSNDALNSNPPYRGPPDFPASNFNTNIYDFYSPYPQYQYRG